MIDAYARAEPALAAHPVLLDDLAQAKAAADLPFIREDVGVLIGESREGVDRLRKIVENLGIHPARRRRLAALQPGARA